MTPELIICDEISNEDDAEAIRKATHSGVKLIATTHAGSYEELMQKEILKTLISSRTFDYYVGVQRKSGEGRYKFSLETNQIINEI
jgi:stage III sporulation protein AA